MKFWEAMKAIDEGKKVYPVSNFWNDWEYLDKSNVLAWFEHVPACHYYLDEWRIMDETYHRAEFGTDIGIRFATQDGGFYLKPGETMEIKNE